MEFYGQWSSDSCSRRIELAVQQALEEIRRDSIVDDLTSTSPLILTYYPLHQPVHNEIIPMEFMEMDEVNLQVDRVIYIFLGVDSCEPLGVSLM